MFSQIILDLVLGLTCDQVDLDACTIRLAAEDTKGGEGRALPFASVPEMRQLLAERHAARNRLFVLHRDGQQIGGGALRPAWARACQAGRTRRPPRPRLAA